MTYGRPDLTFHEADSSAPDGSPLHKLMMRAFALLRDRPHAKHAAQSPMADVLVNDLARQLLATMDREQRLLDLVRQQRQELHEAGLITDEEYAALAADGDAVARLEGYDRLRQELQKVTAYAAEREQARHDLLSCLPAELRARVQRCPGCDRYSLRGEPCQRGCSDAAKR